MQATKQQAAIEFYRMLFAVDGMREALAQIYWWSQHDSKHSKACRVVRWPTCLHAFVANVQMLHDAYSAAQAASGGKCRVKQA
jgi:hypothetical protein